LDRINLDASLPNYEADVDFCITCREPGAVRDDIPVFAMMENAAGSKQFAELAATDARGDEIIREDVEGVPGAFVLRNVLSSAQCDWLIKLTETMGYDEDAPTRLGRNFRQNENCVMIALDDINTAIYERCVPVMPPEESGGEVAGINRRWRFYKYNPGDIFRAHVDPDGWTGSGFDKAGNLLSDCYGDRVSRMTILMYLNDEFEGGGTRFFMDAVGARLGNANRCGRTVTVHPVKGSALCFYHGHHPLSPWHEGAKLSNGTKYVIRSDVLFKFPRLRRMMR